MSAGDIMLIIAVIAVWVWILKPDGDKAHTRRVTLANKRAEAARYQLRRAEVERETARIRAAASPFRSAGPAIDLNKDGVTVVDDAGHVIRRA